MTQDVTEAAEAVFADTGAVRTLVTICNAKGLHARASAKFVRLAEQFDAEIGVRRDGSAVGGTSIMGLMMLAASPGCSIHVSASGPDAGKALEALEDLVEDKFGEEE